MARRTWPSIAWFSPLPPVRSGISRYSAELLPGLAERYAIDVYVDGDPARTAASVPDAVSVRSAHDFLWMHARQPYALVVYQLGNAACHDYMWSYLARFPGLVVLHDGQLHQARGRLLRQQRRLEDYANEFRFDHPNVATPIVELALAGRLHQLIFLWPMRRAVVQSARMVAVHNRWLADEIARDDRDPQSPPDVPAIVSLDMGVPSIPAAADARASIRRQHGIAEDAVVLLALGEITPEKRIPRIIRQLGAVAREVPGVRLLLAGSPADYYDPIADARAQGVEHLVTLAGYVPHERLGGYIEASDVCLCLRWPTSRETSAAWLRCLAGGRATIVTDLAHTADVPAYDPRSWTVSFAPATRTDALGWPLRDDGACVAIDLLDEEHSLRLAIQRLATDTRLRERIGTEARALWERRFTLERMQAAYVDLIEAAMQTPIGPAPRPDLPAHFRRDGTEHAARLLEDIGLGDDRIAQLWRADQPADR
jgi:glycosyltransferase involved in cell wall biosynthesis